MDARCNGAVAQLRCSKPKPGAQIRMVCLPYAGTGCWAFHGWIGKLPPWIELWVAELAGRDSLADRAPSVNLQEYASALSDAWLMQDAKDTVVFGHSMGALIAFELARALRRRSAPLPLALCLSGHRAAHLSARHAPIHALPEEQFLTELRDIQGIPDAVLANRQLTDFFLPVLRADFAACEVYRYRAEPPLDCHIVALGGINDPATSIEEVTAWRAHTRRRYRLRLFTGGHFFINAAREAVLDALHEELSTLVRERSHS
jgi:medium-chain acyl-[acyl-carrier-protein] hydrolase